MNERALHEQQRRAQLDEWKAELDKLKARSMKAGAEAGLAWSRHIGRLEDRVADAERRMVELAEANNEAWAALKKGVDDAWASLKTAFQDAGSKFDKQTTADK